MLQYVSMPDPKPISDAQIGQEYRAVKRDLGCLARVLPIVFGAIAGGGGLAAGISSSLNDMANGEQNPVILIGKPILTTVIPALIAYKGTQRMVADDTISPTEFDGAMMQAARGNKVRINKGGPNAGTVITEPYRPEPERNLPQQIQTLRDFNITYVPRDAFDITVLHLDKNTFELGWRTRDGKKVSGSQMAINRYVANSLEDQGFPKQRITGEIKL